MANKRRSPRWYKGAEDRVAEFVEEFRTSLRTITVRFARHDRADTIDVRHVNEAFEALVKLGLNRQSWWKRPQLKVTVAGGLIGLAFAVPSFVDMFIDDSRWHKPLTCSAIIVLALLSVSVYVWAWCQNRA